MKRQAKNRKRFYTRNKSWYVKKKDWDRFIKEFHKFLKKRETTHRELIELIRKLNNDESFIDIRLPKEIIKAKQEMEDLENSIHIKNVIESF